MVALLPTGSIYSGSGQPLETIGKLQHSPLGPWIAQLRGDLPSLLGAMEPLQSVVNR